MSLSRSYDRLRNVSSNTPDSETETESAIATSYKSDLNITTANINTAHNYVTDAYEPLVFIKDKFNDLMDYITDVQNHWFTWISGVNSVDGIDGIVTRLERIGTAPAVYDLTKTYNIGDMVLYNVGDVQYQYMCIANNTSVAPGDATKWKMITPNSLDIIFGTDVEISASNGKIQIVDKTTPSTVYATMLSDLAYYTSAEEANIDVGSVYLLNVDTNENSYNTIMKHKISASNTDVLYPTTPADNVQIANANFSYTNVEDIIWNELFEKE